MFAVLGDIEFTLLTSFEALEGTFGTDYAEHARVKGKPGLQFIGDQLDEYSITLVFHRQYCDPQTRVAAINQARIAHQALAFVLGNGDYKGYFVISAITSTTQMMDARGALQSVQLQVTLREFTGDPKNPLKPPAIQGNLPGVAALQKSALNAGGLGGMVRSAAGYARQVQSALQTASNVVRVARQMTDNPVAALTRIPGVLTSLGNVAEPLAKSIPALGALTSYLPETVQLARAAGESATFVKNAISALERIDKNNPVNLPAALDTVANTVGSAVTTMDKVSPNLSQLTSRIMTRSL